MTNLAEVFHAVLLYGRRIGTLCQRGDYTRFVLNESYLDDPTRPVLGLRFEENLYKPYAAALRLPTWFSNLLPEGPLRVWVAEARNVSLDREMELLAQVGHDLPGAVQVFSAAGPDESWEWPDSASWSDRDEGNVDVEPTSPWRFSLAGVALKFSMLAKGDRLTVPAAGQFGDWLVKFPDYRFANVPRNEYTMMRLAGKLGIEVPEVRLLHRDELDGLPSQMWPNSEEWAYAVRRFDRLYDDTRTHVHIEDFAQVRDKYPQEKYEGTFETVAALAYRGRDLASLREMARRVAFNVLTGNGDAHLKNWSLIYPDRRIPRLSPAYDLVSTVVYRDQADGPEDLGMKLSGSMSFDKVSVASFRRLESRIDSRFGRTGANLADVAADVAQRINGEWSGVRDELAHDSFLSSQIGDWIVSRIPHLLRR
ncbi:type II toxin-antitoxin system HipA family toxin [Kibdelosporangium philippinense]|uniref:Type II toxin-antitoxin system HipA family toxin n=1 Tax=Kibdelosporangium philippinense TaxID=211113 RepID=A0ABS8ZGH0_9PSEU|nr:type II toxin-antitoxin system HipA family toxin [Kibdelosporangium philippinense]MCE7004932.1 type II toxin-antitoxin system HipA family toxin [Kibdelosporangium philippinense]